MRIKKKWLEQQHILVETLKLETSMAEKSSYLYVQGDANSCTIKSLKGKHEELVVSLERHGTLFDKIDKDSWKKESELNSLKSDLKSLKKEVKETRRVVRKQSLSPPTVCCVR